MQRHMLQNRLSDSLPHEVLAKEELSHLEAVTNNRQQAEEKRQQAAERVQVLRQRLQQQQENETLSIPRFDQVVWKGVQVG